MSGVRALVFVETDGDARLLACRAVDKARTKQERSEAAELVEQFKEMFGDLQFDGLKPGVWLVVGNWDFWRTYDGDYDAAFENDELPRRIPVVSELFNAWAWVAWKVRQIMWWLERRGAA